LHNRFDCATFVADSAIELYEICLPHSYILCSFALFFYPLLTLDSHFQYKLIQNVRAFVVDKGGKTALFHKNSELFKKHVNHVLAQSVNHVVSHTAGAPLD